MESGNSSSMQSSSGGDDQEFDESSGGAVIGSSANYYTASNVNNTTTQPSQYNNPTMFMLSSAQHPPQPLLQPPLSAHHQHQSNYLDAFETQSNYQNLMFWQQPQQFGSSSAGGGLPDHISVNNPRCTANSTTHLSAHVSGGGALSISSTHHQQSGNSPKSRTSQPIGVSASASAGSGAGTGKNPRKRTRASRRAPTTVLTTDTSNFRAMVQEFTGIPSSPFSAAASPLLSRRLTDLFTGNSSSPSPNLRPGPPLPMVGPSSSLERLLTGYNNSSYPLRPSAHKLNSTTTTTNNTSAVSPLTNLSFQSLLQSTPPPSSLRYSPSVPSAAGLLTPNVGNLEDLSGVIGSDPMFGFAPMRLAPDGGGWRGGSSGGGVVASNEHGGDHEGNIGAQKNDDNGNNNVSNQQMAGSISGTGTGSGTSNYNVNMNCSRDKGLESSTPNRGGAQDMLGDFLG